MSTPPPGWDWSEQVYREGAAYAVASAACVHRCAGKVMLVISDCDPVVCSAAKGARGSDVLHKAVRHAALEAIEYDASLAVLWAPGQKMVDWGIDGLSREGATSLHDASVGPELWLKACNLAADMGGFTVDWFGDASAHVLPRYWARYADGGAEGVDALLAPSWRSGTCSCGCTHNEVGWFFPPLPLVGPMLAKAQREGASGVALLPMQIGEPWWPLVEEAAVNLWEVTGITTPFVHASPAYCSNEFAWALCVFNFGSDPSATAPCDMWSHVQERMRSPVVAHAHEALVQAEKALAVLAAERAPAMTVDHFGELAALD